MSVRVKFQFYRSIGVSPLEAILWAGEEQSFASKLG